MPIPDDWTIEQYGAYDLGLLFSATMCFSRAFSAYVPINGVSQDFVTAKEYGMSDYTAKCERAGRIYLLPGSDGELL